MSSKRKQEEKHLKILKSALQVECNKRCFECDQRGPTYVDVTIGSFVCTTCGGILRGLNPPHRVKSVSMATFTPAEISFIESRGNEFCKNIYLGKYDSRLKTKPDSKNHAKFKFFMEEKYEKKLWYVPPEEAQKPVDSSMKSARKSPTNGNVKPLSSLLGNNVLPVAVDKPPSNQPAKVDIFLPDFNSPASSNTAPSSNQSTSSTGGFADFNNAFSSQGFDAFGDFTSGQPANPAPASTSNEFANFSSLLAPMSTATATQQSVANPIKPADKYSDLGDLFSTDTAGTPDITAMWSGFSASTSSTSVNNTNTGVFGLSGTQQTGTLLSSTSQPQTSVFGTAQPPSAFSNIQQQPQQPTLFGTPATSSFGNMAQPGLVNMQPQVASTFGSMQQQPGMFGIQAQPRQTTVPFGNVQQTPMGAASYGANQFNPTAAFGTSPQNMYNTQQSQGFGGGAAAASVANPFMQSAAPSTAQQPIGGNPFMMQQQQAQNPFPAQPAATNPFMNNQNPSRNQMSSNPFF